MATPIHDEFSDLPLSRQMKCCLRMRRDRRCTKCGKPAEIGSLCLEHMVQMREHRRKILGMKRRYHGSLSYQAQQQLATNAGMGTPIRQRPDPIVPEPNIQVELGVPIDHPLRPVKQRVDCLLKNCAANFETAYSGEQRPEIGPVIILKSWVLMNLFCVRSTHLFCEQLGYNLLWLWFLDRNMNQGTFDPQIFTQAYDRVLATDAARQFFRDVFMSAGK